MTNYTEFVEYVLRGRRIYDNSPSDFWVRLGRYLENPTVATEDGSCGLKGTVLDLLTPETVRKALLRP